MTRETLILVCPSHHANRRLIFLQGEDTGIGQIGVVYHHRREPMPTPEDKKEATERLVVEQVADQLESVDLGDETTSCREPRVAETNADTRKTSVEENVDDENSNNEEDAPSLFADPPPGDECPVCFTTLPINLTLCTYVPCCGNTVCGGCMYAHDRIVFLKNATKSEEEPQELPTCPFCRAEMPACGKNIIRLLKKRAEKNDPIALERLAGDYSDGDLGLPVNETRALELYRRAADLGNPAACYALSAAYCNGELGVLQDDAKATEYLERAAKCGHIRARHHLGYLSDLSGDKDSATKHWRISAAAGHKASMDALIEYFQRGVINKSCLEKSLRAKHVAWKETQTDERDQYVEFLKSIGKYKDAKRFEEKIKRI